MLMYVHPHNFCGIPPVRLYDFIVVHSHSQTQRICALPHAPGECSEPCKETTRTAPCSTDYRKLYAPATHPLLTSTQLRYPLKSSADLIFIKRKELVLVKRLRGAACESRKQWILYVYLHTFMKAVLATMPLQQDPARFTTIVVLTPFTHRDPNRSSSSLYMTVDAAAMTSAMKINRVTPRVVAVIVFIGTGVVDLV